MAGTKPIDLVLGTMTIGDQLKDNKDSSELLDYFFNQGYSKLDTARMYAQGNTERILGEILSEDHKNHIASKVSNAIGEKALTRKGITDQVEDILRLLKIQKLELLYLHWPDRKTPLEETLGAINDLHKEGKFTYFGLSNYKASEVSQICQLCKEHNWVQPTVYQGMYNAITRDVEKELLPVLHEFNIKFYIYNPLAGGILTGKHSFTSGKGAELEGRFKSDSGAMQQRYIERYWKDDIFEALKIVQEACAKHNISMTEASLRWVRHHSQLISGDAIILGASKLDHLKENIRCATVPEKLPEEIVKAFDVAWEKAKPSCQQYWR